jgi:hypothetical protein
MYGRFGDGVNAADDGEEVDEEASEDEPCGDDIQRT